MKSKEVGWREETWKENEWKDMVFLINHVSRTMTDAYYFAEYDLRKRAEVIAIHYRDPRMDITEQVGSFRNAVDQICGRVGKILLIPAEMDWPLKDFYILYFLREVGLRTLGLDVRDMEMGARPDDYMEQVMAITGDYAPREYYKKEQQPPTVFDVLDDFADSIIEAIKH